ncbi:15869_t:CDS:2, partial [Gigaspora margarita]
LETDWKRIKALIGETVWNSLTSDTKYKVDPHTIMKVIFESRAEDIGITRLNLTKSLIKQSVDSENHFYEDIWKKKCEQIISWEKRKGITKQFKLFVHHGSPSTSTKKKQSHKIDVGPHDGSGSGSSKVFINTGIQQESKNEDSTLVLKQATI